jgi:hypothetical protein
VLCYASLSIHHPALTVEPKAQSERDWVLSEFRTGSSPIMVATDVAARGLDVKDVDYVINFDFPQQIEDYIHRIGRKSLLSHLLASLLCSAWTLRVVPCLGCYAMLCYAMLCYAV